MHIKHRLPLVPPFTYLYTHYVHPGAFRRCIWLFIQRHAHLASTMHPWLTMLYDRALSHAPCHCSRRSRMTDHGEVVQQVLYGGEGGLSRSLRSAMIESLRRRSWLKISRMLLRPNPSWVKDSVLFKCIVYFYLLTVNLPAIGSRPSRCNTFCLSLGYRTCRAADPLDWGIARVELDVRSARGGMSRFVQRARRKDCFEEVRLTA